jgi:hypothetical protein
MLGVFHITSLHSENVQCAPNRINIFYVATEGLAMLSMAQYIYTWFSLLNLPKWKCVLCSYCRKRVNLMKKNETDNVCITLTLTHVRATIVAVEKQWVLHKMSVCICSFRFPARRAHAPYRHLWPAPLYNIFPHFLKNGTIIEKSYWKQNVCFDFLYNSCVKHFSF